MQLARAILYVQAPLRLAEFYTQHLGMRAVPDGDCVRIGYPQQQTCLELRPAAVAGPYQHRRNDRYWKIGVTLPNVDLACTQLRAAQVAVSAPAQFRNIGYLCHFSDPEGFQVELLQHDFQHNRPANAGDPDLPLGGGAAIGQITLRVTDIDAALAFYQRRAAMKLLSVQPLTELGFTLYFLAHTEEDPPRPALEAVENREWLWRRPYTTLELQHVPALDGAMTVANAGAVGYHGLVFTGAPEDERIDDPHLGPIQFCQESAHWLS